MSGVTRLDQLLRNLNPILNPGTFVFCTVAGLRPELHSEAIGSFKEAEGHTYILPRPVADQHSLSYAGTMAWITLQVHSSLEAVGLTAAVSAVLAEAGISCNVVAAYYHDHLLVPTDRADRALELLKKLSNDQLTVG
jgi:hypothetical protein